VPRDWRVESDRLRDRDVIIGCVDTYRARSELEMLARRYLIPYLDIGMDVHSRSGSHLISGQVILSMRGAPCCAASGFLRPSSFERGGGSYGDAGGPPPSDLAERHISLGRCRVLVQLFTPWHPAHNLAVYLEYDGNAQTVGTRATGCSMVLGNARISTERILSGFRGMNSRP